MRVSGTQSDGEAGEESSSEEQCSDDFEQKVLCQTGAFCVWHFEVETFGPRRQITKGEMADTGCQALFHHFVAVALGSSS